MLPTGHVVIRGVPESEGSLGRQTPTLPFPPGAAQVASAFSLFAIILTTLYSFYTEGADIHIKHRFLRQLPSVNTALPEPCSCNYCWRRTIRQKSEGKKTEGPNNFTNPIGD